MEQKNNLDCFCYKISFDGEFYIGSKLYLKKDPLIDYDGKNYVRLHIDPNDPKSYASNFNLQNKSSLFSSSSSIQSICSDLLLSTLNDFFLDHSHSSKISLSSFKNCLIAKCNFYGYSYDSYFNDLILQDFIHRYYYNLHCRMQRFKHKAYNNKWSYFFTITYDDSKFESEDLFRLRLTQCFKDLHNRRGWLIIGAFERGHTRSERLHFHGFCYVPTGKMIGENTLKKTFDINDKHIHRKVENSYFLERFGMNEFDDIHLLNNPKDLTSSINYLIKYISKDGEKMFYSRGIPEYIYIIPLPFDDYPIACPFLDNPLLYSFPPDVLERSFIIGNRPPS